MGELTVGSLREAAPLLRRPFTPEAVKFKPQSVLGEGKGVLCVAYIDARLVYERLNLVCPDLWTDHYRAVGDGLMWCDLTVDGITRSDVGEGQGKALVSDALKRAAVHFGVGVSLYAIPQQKIWANDGGGKLVSIWQSGTKANNKPKFDARLEDAGEKALREAYRKWLAAHGSVAFGQPLDHGDAEGSQGDAEVQAQPDPQEAPKQAPKPETIPAEAVKVLYGQVSDLIDSGAADALKVRTMLTAVGVKDAKTIKTALAALSPAQAKAFQAQLDNVTPEKAAA